MKADEGVADVVVAFVDGGGDLLHHLLLGLRGYARRCFDVAYRHLRSPLSELSAASGLAATHQASRSCSRVGQCERLLASRVQLPDAQTEAHPDQPHV